MLPVLMMLPLYVLGFFLHDAINNNVHVEINTHCRECRLNYLIYTWTCLCTVDLYISELLQVERIRLSHDNSGPNPEWYLESLRIEIPSRDEKYMFPCNRWLTGDEDRRVEVEVYPGMLNIFAMKLIS